MTGPENLESRIQSAQVEEPTKLALAIARRGLAEAHLARIDTQARHKRDVDVSQQTIYDKYLVDTTARAVMVYPDDVPDYFSFSETRLRFLPSAEAIWAAELDPEDFFREIPQEELIARQEKAQGIHKMLRNVFVGGSIFIPPVGAVTELAKMREVAHDMVPTNSLTAMTERARTVGLVGVYQRDTRYADLQVRYYREPARLEQVGNAAIAKITPHTIARLEEYDRTGEMPPPNERLFIADRHETAAVRQRHNRKQVLDTRIMALPWS